MPRAIPVYVVDDEADLRQVLIGLCAERNLAARGFADGEQFLEAADGLDPGCVLLDMRLPGRTGLEVLAALARRGLRFPVIAIAGHADVDMAVETMKRGAVDFLEKPFGAEELISALDRALAMLDEARAQEAVSRNGAAPDGFNA